MVVARMTLFFSSSKNKSSVCEVLVSFRAWRYSSSKSGTKLILGVSGLSDISAYLEIEKIKYDETNGILKLI